MKTVAAAAGVSLATVSHTLNDTAYVSPILRERVLKAIRRLNYRPNAMARGLRTKRSKTVGIIIPDISDPFFHPIVRGAEDVLLHEGYTLLVGNSDSDVKKEELYYNTFLLKQVDGILDIVSPSERTPEFLLQHNPETTPIVYLDRFHRGLRGDMVLLDDVDTSRRAVAHLIERGHQRIATITGPLILHNARRRLEGYRRALLESGIPVDEKLIREGAFDQPSGYEHAKALLGLSPRPTAILVCNALMTIGALHATFDLGVSCPREIALVSFSDMELFDLVRPSVTAFKQPVYELGAKAAEILVDRLKGKLRAPFRRITLKSELVPRESSQAVRKSKMLAAAE